MAVAVVVAHRMRPDRGFFSRRALVLVQPPQVQVQLDLADDEAAQMAVEEQQVEVEIIFPTLMRFFPGDKGKTGAQLHPLGVKVRLRLRRLPSARFAPGAR